MEGKKNRILLTLLFQGLFPDSFSYFREDIALGFHSRTVGQGQTVVTGMTECEGGPSHPPGSIIRYYSREGAVRSRRCSSVVDRSIARCMGQQLSRLLSRGLFPGLRPRSDRMPRDRSHLRILGNHASPMVRRSTIDFSFTSASSSLSFFIKLREKKHAICNVKRTAALVLKIERPTFPTFGSK